MNLSLTSDQIRLAAPKGKPVIIDAIALQSARVFAKYKIDNDSRVIGLMSVIIEETGGLRALSEDLNYSAERAHEIFPHYFPTVASAEPYAYNPVAFGNKVYGGRMGNTRPGDGYLFRGEGLPQITGHDNFALVQKLTGLQTLTTPELVTLPEYMLECAVALFVQYTDILGYCDSQNWRAVWALVGSGSANGKINNPENHEAALVAAKRMKITYGAPIPPASVKLPDPIIPAKAPPAPPPSSLVVDIVSKSSAEPAPVSATPVFSHGWIWAIVALIVAVAITAWLYFRSSH